MRSEMLVLLVPIMMTIQLTGCLASHICSLPVTSCQIEEMKFRLAEAINFTSKVVQTLKDAEETRCSLHPEDCEAVYKCGSTSSGVYTIWPRSRILKTSVQVYCDMETDGGGWTVIQRRGDFGRAQDYFFNDWDTFKVGFGDISQDFWLGNDLIFALTNQKRNSLRFDFRDLAGETRWAFYDDFWIDSEDYNYTMRVRGYTGNAGDSFTVHSGCQFSTKDRDNDIDDTKSCSLTYKGGWWYHKCHSSNLNGLYLNGNHTSWADGIEWKTWHGYKYSLPFTEMKIRNTFFRREEQQQTTNIIPS